MGKAKKWFRALLGKNSRDSNKSGSKSRSPVAGNNSVGAPPSSPYSELDANKHAIAVAAATAAVAEAALAAAQAAAEVVRLTSTPAPYTSRDRWRELAAVRIQAAFRGFLARKARRALRGLVKLQAIVRGRIERRKTAEILQRMQAMARIQARACSNRAVLEPSPPRLINSDQHRRAGSPSRARHDSPQRSYGNKHERLDHKRRMLKPNPNSSIKLEGLHLGSSWLDRWMEECAWNNSQKEASDSNNVSRDDETTAKILEIDNWKQPTNNQRQRERHIRRAGTFDPLSGHDKPNPSVSSIDALSLRSLKFPPQEELTAENSPNPYLHSASSIPGSSRRGPFTPTRSECSRSIAAEYMSHPSYMATTESYLAKVRSQSAPRQRNRSSAPGLWDQDSSLSEKGSATPSSHHNRTYRGSGLNRVGTPLHYPG